MLFRIAPIVLAVIFVCSFISQNVMAVVALEPITPFQYLTLSHMDPKNLTADERTQMGLYELGIRPNSLLDLPTSHINNTVSNPMMKNETISIKINQTPNYNIKMK